MSATAPYMDICETLSRELAAARLRIRKLDSALDDVETYLEDREDVVDGSYGEPAPNKEMQLLATIRFARGAT